MIGIGCQPTVFKTDGKPPADKENPEDHKETEEPLDPVVEPPKVDHNPNDPKVKIDPKTGRPYIEVVVEGRIVKKGKAGSKTKINAEIDVNVDLRKKTVTVTPPQDKQEENPDSSEPNDDKNGDDPGTGSDGDQSDQTDDPIDRIETVTKTKSSLLFKSETAGFLNTFGWYKIDVNNKIYDVQLIWLNASQVGSPYGSGPLQPGDMVNLGTLEPGVKLGFFIIANGYEENNWDDPNAQNYLDLGNGKGQLEFRDGESYTNSQQASLKSSSPLLWYVPTNGEPRVVQSKTNEYVDHGYNAIYHTAAEKEDSLQLNPDNINHIRHHVLEENKRFSIEIEDLYYRPNAPPGEFDGDYADLIFELQLEPIEVVIKSFD